MGTQQHSSVDANGRSFKSSRLYNTCSRINV